MTGMTVGVAALLGGCAGLPQLWPEDDPAPAAATTRADARPGAIAVSPAVPAPAAAATATADLWQRVGIELRLGDAGPGTEPLATFGHGRATIEQAAARARPFLGHIVAEIERRGLPLEIALVPVIESGYDPAATSPAGAAGLWQLMPATARRFGLVQSRWFDGRRDLLESTRAALDYFEALRDRFLGDWKLVFAAYNCGERTVERAIERNRRQRQPSHFEALTLPRATRDYVPRLLALAEIVAHPQAYGVSLPPIDAAPQFEVVDVGGSLDLERVVEWGRLDRTQFARLNAGFRKNFAVDGAPTRVLVPPDAAAAVRAALAGLPAEERRRPREYVVAAGDTLSHIAAKTAVSVAALKRTNGLGSNRLNVGQRLLIPPPAQAQALALAPEPEPEEKPSHTVVSGDNLWDLARRYGTSVAALAAANGISRSATLRLGQELRVPRGDVAARAAAPAAEYEVRAGDSLWTISRRFRISVAELRRWNGLGHRQLLQPGQRLVVSPPGNERQDI